MQPELLKAPCTATILFVTNVLRSRQCKHEWTHIAWYMVDFPTAVAPQLESHWSWSPAFPDAVWVTSPLMQSLFTASQRHPWLTTLLMQCWSPSLIDALVVLLLLCWLPPSESHAACCQQIFLQRLLVVKETPPGRFLLHTLHWAQRELELVTWEGIPLTSQRYLHTKWAW